MKNIIAYYQISPREREVYYYDCFTGEELPSYVGKISYKYTDLYNVGGRNGLSREMTLRELFELKKRCNAEIYERFFQCEEDRKLECKQYYIQVKKRAIDLIDLSEFNECIKHFGVSGIDFLCTLIEEKNDVKDYIETQVKYALKYGAWSHYNNILGENFPRANNFPATEKVLYYWLGLEAPRWSIDIY